MFTQQANQIATAMRTAGGNAQSAQEMIQAMCNCAQTLEHRGPVDFNYTDPWFANYPTTSPPQGRIEPYTPQSGFPTINVNFPPIPQVSPWNPVAWTDVPPVDVPSNTSLSYPFGPGNGSPNSPGTFTPWSPNGTVNVGGPVTTPQMTVSGPTYTNNIYTQNVTNYGDTYNEGDTYTEGDVYVGGDTYNEGDVTNNSAVYIGGPTTTQGTTLTQNYTYSFGPQHFYSAVWFFGPVNLKRKTIVRMGNINLRLQEQEVVSRVWLQNNILRTVTRKIFYLGQPRLPQVRVVFTVVNGGASFDQDTCEITEDNGENPQITFVKSIDPPA